MVKKFLPLGDSYTIGEGVALQDSWPEQFLTYLNKKERHWKIPINPSKTGFTTQDLIDKELPLVKEFEPDKISLLIGVNDWVQEVDESVYRKNIKDILVYLSDYIDLEHDLLALNIPDFSLSKEGHKYAKGRDIAAGLHLFNEVFKEECNWFSVNVVDIYSLTQTLGTDEANFAPDGLHPSAGMYKEWVKLIIKEIEG